MADITFQCEYCEQSLEAPEDMGGETIECPNCGESILVPVPEAEEAGDDGTACPSCGALMDDGSVLCLQCGYHSGLGRKIETNFA